MGKKYSVHSIFLTILGEGFHAGTVSVMARFSGCNVWTGLEKHRQRDAKANSPCAEFCDTEFFGHDLSNGGGTYELQDLVDKISETWGSSINPQPMVVFTGGEPSLQLDSNLVKILQLNDFFVAVETNGSLPLCCTPDWITLSPKPPKMVLPQDYNEIKVLYPVFNPLDFAGYAVDPSCLDGYLFVQPVDYGPKDIRTKDSIKCCVDFVKMNREWKISIQQHKVLGVQ